jgi:hypothetical protein
MSHHRLTLIPVPGRYAICRLDRDSSFPPWASSGGFVSVTRTSEELSVVCLEPLVPEGVKFEPGWRCLRVAGTIAFSTTGIVASLVAPLASAEIGVFVVSTFDTDYLLIKDVDFVRATVEFCAAGHTLN